MMRLYVLGFTLIIGLSLLLPGCNGPADSKDPQRWWNAKVSEKDTAGVYVQVFDRNTGALTSKHKLEAGAQVRIIFDSSAKVGANVNLCRASMVYFMTANNQLMSGTLDESSQFILIDQNVEFPPGDPTICELHEFIGVCPGPLEVRVVDVSTGAITTDSRTIPASVPFWFSDCRDHEIGAPVPLPYHHLIWVEIGETGGGRTPCVIESPMPVTVTGRLAH